MKVIAVVKERLYMNKITKYISMLLIPAPSVIVGVLAMITNSVPNTLYLQNIISVIVLWIGSCFVIRTKGTNRGNFSFIITVIIVLLFILTFIDSGISGVHRWISIGPIKLYITSILIPLLVILLWEQFNKANNLFAILVTCLVSIILLLQPDASQMTSFGIVMIILFYKKINKKVVLGILISILILMIIFSWIFLDSLPSVTYVEEIIRLVIEMGFMWTIFGIVSLIILIFPFILFPRNGYKLLSRCIGLYYILVLTTTYFGNFPVPMMGFGISPIIGYFFALTWLFKT